jgi:cyclophilin family peptidyl-prolyl cis-trans isomerase
MIQGGDPEGNGMGGESAWGGNFDGGADPHLIHAAGALAYANSGSTATNGSQFYIVTGEVYSDDEIEELQGYDYGLSDSQIEIYSTAGGVPWLDGGYTVFGQVFDGLDVVFDVQNVDTDDNDKPNKDVKIESMTVEKYSGEPVRFFISDYAEASTSSSDENKETTTAEKTEASEEESTASEEETTAAED